MNKPLVVIALLAAFTPAGVASAATIKVAYTGVVSEVHNTTATSGYKIGDDIVGSMTLTLPNTPQRSFSSGVPTFDEYNGTGSNTINGNTISGFGGVVNNSQPSFASLSFGVSQNVATVQYGESLFFEGAPSALLGSLDKLPTTLASIRGYLTTLDSFTGGYIFVTAPGAHLWDIRWNVQSVTVSAVAPAPLPGTLPLFATALIGIGMLGRRQIRRGA
jgi:hypothetical protein